MMGGDVVKDRSLEDVQNAIRQTYGCDAELVGREHIHEQFDGEPAWEGEVLVFQLPNHPTAKHCYAWEKDGRVVLVLHAGHVTSPVRAVRASLLGELDAPRKHE